MSDIPIPQIPKAGDLTPESIKHAIDNLDNQIRYMNEYAYDYIRATLVAMKAKIEADTTPAEWLAVAERRCFVIRFDLGGNDWPYLGRDNNFTSKLKQAMRYTLAEARAKLTVISCTADDYKIELLPEHER